MAGILELGRSQSIPSNFICDIICMLSYISVQDLEFNRCADRLLQTPKIHSYHGWRFKVVVQRHSQSDFFSMTPHLQQSPANWTGRSLGGNQPFGWEIPNPSRGKLCYGSKFTNPWALRQKHTKAKIHAIACAEVGDCISVGTGNSVGEDLRSASEWTPTWPDRYDFKLSEDLKWTRQYMYEYVICDA